MGVTNRVKKMVPPYRSPVKLEVARDGTPATALGGLVVLLELLAATRVLAALPGSDGSSSQGWSDGQMILAVLFLNVAGFDRVSDIDRLEGDAGLCALVGRFEAKLFGLSRRALARRFRGGRERCFPSARSLRDWLDRFHVAGVHDVEREKGKAFIPAHSERHELFREVGRRLVAEGVREAGAGSVTIDLDATIIASGKRECLYTYQAAERVVPGERGYQPLVAFCPEIGMAPWLENRDGNVPASMDNLRALEEALLQLPGAVRRVTLRTDGAGYQEDVIRACNDPAFRRQETRRFGTVGLICGATRSQPLMAEVARLAEDAGRPMTGPVETRNGRASPGKVELECAELPYVPATANGLKPHHVIRYVVTRRALPGKLGLDEGELPATDGRPAYRIRAYMTNFPAPDAIPAEKANGLKVMEAAEVVAAAHQRCGHGEEVHAVLKSDLAAGMMPSGRFGANAAWLWLAALALNAMALLRRAAYGPEWRWMRMKRIRAMNDLKKSDPAVVAMRPANKGRQRPAELVEPRAGAEGNPESQSTRRAQKRASVTQAADRIRQAAKRNPDERLVALLHHITVPVLEEAFHSLKRDAAAGVDGVTWDMYAEGL